MDSKVLSKASIKQTASTTPIVNWTEIVLAGGNKGGVGKSFHARVLIEAYLEKGVFPIIFEGDGGNSDIAKFFDVRRSYDLNRPDGFVDLFEAIEHSPVDRPVVVSLPAGANEKSEQHSPAFFDALADLANAHNRSVRMHWMIDDKRDGVEALRAFRIAHPDIPVDVVRNLFFGPPAAFDLFEASKERAGVLEGGGRIVDLPALSGRVAREILIKRLTHAQALSTLGFLDRREFQSWWKAVLANYRQGGILQ